MRTKLLIIAMVLLGLGSGRTALAQSTTQDGEYLDGYNFGCSGTFSYSGHTVEVFVSIYQYSDYLNAWEFIDSGNSGAQNNYAAASISDDLGSTPGTAECVVIFYLDGSDYPPEYDLDYGWPPGAPVAAALITPINPVSGQPLKVVRGESVDNRPRPRGLLYRFSRCFGLHARSKA